MCLQEEERLKSSQGDSANLVKDNKKKNFNKNAKPQGKTPQNDHHPKNNNAQVENDQYKWCKKHGHYQRDCPDFLKSLLKRGEDFITFIDESLYLSYAKSTWWIDSGATVHVANSLQGFHMRTLQRGGLLSVKKNHCSPKRSFSPFTHRVNAIQWCAVSV